MGDRKKLWLKAAILTLLPVALGFPVLADARFWDSPPCERLAGNSLRADRYVDADTRGDAAARHVPRPGAPCHASPRNGFSLHLCAERSSLRAGAAVFNSKTDADQFRAELTERMRKFHLELHPEKTRLLEFGPSSGIVCGASSLAGCHRLTSVIPIPCAAWASSPKARAGCGNPACPDPWRGL